MSHIRRIGNLYLKRMLIIGNRIVERCKFGIYLHWGVYSVPAYSYEWYSRHMFMESRKEYQYHKEHYGDPREFGYDKLVPLFRAEHFNAKEWVDLFQQRRCKDLVAK